MSSLFFYALYLASIDFRIFSVIQSNFHDFQFTHFMLGVSTQFMYTNECTVDYYPLLIFGYFSAISLSFLNVYWTLKMSAHYAKMLYEIAFKEFKAKKY